MSFRHGKIHTPKGKPLPNWKEQLASGLPMDIPKVNPNYLNRRRYR